MREGGSKASWALESGGCEVLLVWVPQGFSGALTLVVGGQAALQSKHLLFWHHPAHFTTHTRQRVRARQRSKKRQTEQQGSGSRILKQESALIPLSTVSSASRPCSSEGDACICISLPKPQPEMRPSRRQQGWTRSLYVSPKTEPPETHQRWESI